MAGSSKSKAASTQPAAFYKGALSKAERVQFSEAREVEGLDQEIALLRLKLRQLLEQDPDKVEMLFKGVNLLLRAVATRYRLSPRSRDDLAESISAVLNDIGNQLLPERLDGIESS